MPSSQSMLKALTAPNVPVSPLMTAFLVQATHLFCNALLISPWNPARCNFWNQETCSNDDVVWILNWFSFYKFHLAVLLGFLGAFSLGPSTSASISISISTASMESKMGLLSLSIILCYLVEGVMSAKYFNVPMAIFQAFILMVLMLVILFLISSEELRPGSVYLASAQRSRSLTQSQRHKIAIPTVTLGIQAFLSALRVADLTFGSSLQGGYSNDSSELYQNISGLAICDVMLVPVVMIFALFFCTVDQHRALLKGQVVALLVSLIILSSSQAEKMAKEQVQASMVGTFTSIVLSVAGSL